MVLRSKKAQATESLVIARDIEEFDLLIEDMDGEYPEVWSSSDLAGASKAIAALDEDTSESVILAVQREDEDNLDQFVDLIKQAKAADMLALLVLDEVSPAAMHRLIRSGADDFTPYPLPEGVFSETVSKLRERPAQAEATTSSAPRGRGGMILPVYGVAGGVGGTTFATNLAWELAQSPRKVDRKVCILDLDLQYGSVASSLDIARREASSELMLEPQGKDRESFSSAMSNYKQKLDVLTAPPDSMPYDVIAPEDLRALLEIARASYDFVVIDMPKALVSWSTEVLSAAEAYFVIMEIDMRSAQNMLRFLRLLKSEDLPIEKLQYILNRAPGGLDLGAKTRVKRMAESLGIEYNVLLPDGGKTVTSANDQGEPLAEHSGSNALRKEIRKVAKTLTELAEKQRNSGL
ncbi:AAA family ATPase [Pontivivens insulae]|uniref:Septum site-determining protein MinD n=1 Tax=Pontivivens insulae TaxID=1639689 RepID=A0A2R8A8R3_9RHOB|nr:AAA family ATPase [Pontivivens insulae]RED18711.1 pilus assembly protein CpaE [Pontivivens insulae]SPF28609.1 Septum site-determining protein MinD [Pontivivens insulae]